MNNDVRRLRMLSDYLTSEALCDVLAQMDLHGHLSDMVGNWCDAHFLGRAAPLRLRRLREGENPDGVYGALESYNEIVDNDVIVVGTDRPSCAYFGELNAILAKRQGAAGAVIAGSTRDVEATACMNFPVFSRGFSPCDCKGRVTLDSIGQPITIGIVSVSRGDLVFADSGGVVVIPAVHEEEVIRRAVEAIAKEANIRRTLLDATIEEAIALHGTF